MLFAGNEVVVVSKPRLSLVSSLCRNIVVKSRKDQILFRFTIGSSYDEVLSFWEPGASGFQERLDCLEMAVNDGFNTSVSMEPLLDTDEDDIVRLVDTLDQFVSEIIWIGKMNQVQRRLKYNGFWDESIVQEKARELMDSQSDDRIISLYERLKGNPTVWWKDSIREVIRRLLK